MPTLEFVLGEKLISLKGLKLEITTMSTPKFKIGDWVRIKSKLSNDSKKYHDKVSIVTEIYPVRNTLPAHVYESDFYYMLAIVPKNQSSGFWESELTLEKFYENLDKLINE